MITARADIISMLQKEILSLQGFKQTKNHLTEVGLGQLRYAFPNNQFPLGAVHEFITNNNESTAASTGFIAAVLSLLIQRGGAAIWISSSQNIFPPALQSFGIDAGKIIFINVQNEKERIWAVEEAFKCDSLVAVIAEMKQLDFTMSRRFQLATEQSRVTGFIIRNENSINTTACVARWRITSLPSELADDMPGVGFPRWNVELLKVRNGKPGSWQIEWNNGRFRYIDRLISVVSDQQRKTG